MSLRSKDGGRPGNEHRWQTMQGDSWGGYTAIAAYALLAAGEQPTEPRLKKAIDVVKRGEPHSGQVDPT